MSLELFDKPIKFRDAKIIATGVNPAEYHNEEAERGSLEYVLTRSSLMAFRSCPKKWINGWTPKDSTSTTWGSLIDCLVLTPEQFPKCYVCEPTTYPAPEDSTYVKQKKGKAGDPLAWNNMTNYCKEWREQQEAKGLEVVSNKLMTEAEFALKRLAKDERISELLRVSNRQVWIDAIYFDERTKLSVKIKTLIDLVPIQDPHKNSLADFKTTRSGHPSTWQKAVNLYGYDAQAALCLDLYNAAVGDDRNTFLHVIQENAHPYQTARRMVSHDFVQLGRMKIQAALENYCRCIKTGIWPDWDEFSGFDGWGIVSPEPWMISNLEANYTPEADDEEETEELSGAWN